MSHAVREIEETIPLPHINLVILALGTNDVAGDAKCIYNKRKFCASLERLIESSRRKYPDAKVECSDNKNISIHFTLN